MLSLPSFKRCCWLQKNITRGKIRSYTSSNPNPPRPVYHSSEAAVPAIFSLDHIAEIERRLKSSPRMVLGKTSKSGTDGSDPAHKPRRASVLVPFVNAQQSGKSQSSLIFTLRSSNLRNHGGQVSFPGGIMDEDDYCDPILTALRETEEEIGLDRKHVRPLGLFHDVTSLKGVIVTPVIAYIPNWDTLSQNLKLNHNEVDEVFSVDLSILVQPSIYQVDHLSRGRIPRYIIDSNRREKDIWGMTAYVTDWLLRTTLFKL